MKPYYLILITILIVSCSSTPSANSIQTAIAETQAAKPAQQEQVSSPVAPQPKETKAPTDTTEPTVTLVPTKTEEPTLVPTVGYLQPTVLAEFGGTGAIVTDDFQLSACWKAVLYWQVSPNSSGSASLILTSYNKDTGSDKVLVNEFAMDVGALGLNGIAFDPLLGGTYYFQSENTGEAWTGRLVCQDGVAPMGTGMDIQATGGIVTENYSLPACKKSIFNWSVEPNSSGSASLILALCDLKKNCETIVNEFQMDQSDALTGQSLRAIQAGDYFLVSENTLQPWSVLWECKD